MYAIVDIAGQQYKVQKDQKIFVHRLEGEEGSKVDFDQILLIDDDGKIQVGNPLVANTVVKATIVSHLRGDTVKVFKKKRRKGYQKLNGHRQYLSQIMIDSIGEGKVEKAPKIKAEQPKIAKPKAEPKVSAEKEENVIENTTKVSTPQKAKKESVVKNPVEKKPLKASSAEKTKKAPATKKPAEKAKAAKKPVKKKEE
jgi:large subunit ribosomal protein L21